MKFKGTLEYSGIWKAGKLVEKCEENGSTVVSAKCINVANQEEMKEWILSLKNVFIVS